MGLIRRPGRVAIAGGNRRQCTLADLFSRTALEESFTAVEGSQGLKE